ASSSGSGTALLDPERVPGSLAGGSARWRGSLRRHLVAFRERYRRVGDREPVAPHSDFARYSRSRCFPALLFGFRRRRSDGRRASRSSRWYRQHPPTRRRPGPPLGRLYRRGSDRRVAGDVGAWRSLPRARLRRADRSGAGDRLQRLSARRSGLTHRALPPLPSSIRAPTGMGAAELVLQNSPRHLVYLAARQVPELEWPVGNPNKAAHGVVEVLHYSPNLSVSTFGETDGQPGVIAGLTIDGGANRSVTYVPDGHALLDCGEPRRIDLSVHANSIAPGPTARG